MEENKKELKDSANENNTDQGNLEFLKILSGCAQQYMEMSKMKLQVQDAPIQKAGVKWTFGLILVMVLTASILVVLDKIDSSSFTFVIGTVLGYLLSFSKMFILKKEE